MFDDIGGKLKTVAKVSCWIGIVCSVIFAIVFFASNDRYNPTILPGFICLIVGPLASWLGSLTLYGFGELIDLMRQNNHLLKTHFQTQPIGTPVKPSTPTKPISTPANSSTLSKPEYIRHDPSASVMKSGQATDLDVAFLRSLRNEQVQDN